MAICERCGREFLGDQVPLVGMPPMRNCPRCRELKRRRVERYGMRNHQARDRRNAILMLLAAFLILAAVLWSEWRRTKYVPLPPPIEEPLPAPAAVPPDPGPGDDDRPTSQAAMTLDFQQERTEETEYASNAEKTTEATGGETRQPQHPADGDARSSREHQIRQA